MAYEPNTIELLSRISAIDDGYLDVSWLNVTSLPELPETLTLLNCSNTQLSVLPKLPETLTRLYCSNTPLKIQRNAGESIADYSKRWDAWRAEQAYIKRCKEKCWAIKDELADVPDY